MQTTRIHNFSLFVTVLSACLGLLAVGTPAQIYAQPATRAAEKIVFAFADPNICSRYDGVWESDIAHFEVAFHLDSYSFAITTTQEQKSFAEAQKFAANYNATFSCEACRAKDEFAHSFYQNTIARVEGNKILIVTRLPRAALEDTQAEQPAAN